MSATGSTATGSTAPMAPRASARVRAVARARDVLDVRVATLALPVVAWAWAGWSRRWLSDDGFINLRIVEQILAGNGPVFNEGERIEAGTSTLWLAVLVPVRAVVRFVDAEWLAVVLGLVLAVVGLVFAQLGALRLQPRGGRLALPLGALVVVALPPFWDFATSGLETGLTFAWLGVSWWALARRLDQRRAVAAGSPGALAWWVPVVLGLGPLVRPDLAVVTAAWLVALLVVEGGESRPRRVALVAMAGAAPVAYQVFRMAYYGVLVPNTALAKEASLARWDVGWDYVRDLLGATYVLWLPLGVLVALALAPPVVAWLRAGRRAEALVALAPVASAVVAAVYVARVGGDFMHARLLLPAVFALVLPVAAVPVDDVPTARTLATVAAVAAVAAWAAFTAVSLRTGPPAPGALVVDERAFYATVSGSAHPVTLDDYDGWRTAEAAEAARRLAARDARPVVTLDLAGLTDPAARVPAAAHVREPVVLPTGNIGIVGYGAGLHVRVVDRYGLADPLGARIRLEVRGRPGHEKGLPLSWPVARFGRRGARLPTADELASPESAEAVVAQADVAAARRALGCGPLADVLDAVTDPLTPGRLWRNLTGAPARTSLRVPADPIAAARTLCQP